MRKLLLKIYGSVANLRNALYDRGVFKSHSLEAKTISIGNLAFGGTGKTPLVAHVAEILAEAGEKVCILTRGYGRKDPGERVLASTWNELRTDASLAGDEPFELAKQLLGKAIVVSDANRVSAAHWAIENYGVTAFVLDDGFQHRKARRDLDIVCVDATDPYSMLREPFANISRADAIVITRTEMADNVEQIITAIRDHNPAAPVFRASSKLVRSRPLAGFLSGQNAQSDLQRDTPVFAFCGLANPKAFLRSLELEGFSVTGEHIFGDHHVYIAKDIEELERLMTKSGAGALVTTAKDAVKLGGLSMSVPCFVIEIAVSLDDEAAFRELVISS